MTTVDVKGISDAVCRSCLKIRTVSVRMSTTASFTVGSGDSVAGTTSTSMTIYQSVSTRGCRGAPGLSTLMKCGSRSSKRLLPGIINTLH